MPKQTRTIERRGYRPGRPNASDSAARMEALLDIASQVFIERGFKGTSLDEIATRAGASKRTLYTRFASKAELFEAVMERETDSAYQHFGGMLPLDEPVQPTLEKFGHELIRTIVSPRAIMLLRALIATVDPFPELAKSFWEMVSRNGTIMMTNYLREQTARGVLQVEYPELAAHIFHGMLLGPYHLPAQLGVLPGTPVRARKTYVSECVKAFLSSYLPAKAAASKKKAATK